VNPGGGARPPLLADENFPGPAVAALRAAGHDVLWVAELRPGIPDEDVVAWGRAEARVVLTFDRDLAERLVRHRDPPPPGLVLLRLVPTHPTHAAEVVAGLLARTDLAVVGGSRSWTPARSGSDRCCSAPTNGSTRSTNGAPRSTSRGAGGAHPPSPPPGRSAAPRRLADARIVRRRLSRACAKPAAPRSSTRPAASTRSSSRTGPRRRPPPRGRHAAARSPAYAASTAAAR
jgi:predicted nuclease of predicted toxin-antitoxin system